MERIRVFALLGLGLLGALTSPSAKALEAQSSHKQMCRCMPGEACWPSEQTWQALQKKLKGRLVKPTPLLQPCITKPSSKACLGALKKITNPFILESEPSGTQSQGWFNAWQYQDSVYAVEAENAEDIVEAVKFAQKYRIKPVIKGTGHDYLGRSNAKDSLLIWTHKMREVTYHPNYLPNGCDKTKRTQHALSVEAGTRWLEAYDMATNQHARYVQGGGCTTVGAAGGFTQGGGFGSFSRRYGTGAGSVLEFEVVTADGKKRIANACQNTDLFWALRGGGAGTFGVVTKVTFQTHPLPIYTAIYQGKIKASTNESYRALIRRMLTLIKDELANEHWGEQISFSKDRTLEFFLVYQGTDKAEAIKAWAPFKKWIEMQPGPYQLTDKLWEIPPQKLWDLSFWQTHHPELIHINEQNGLNTGQYWWQPNQHEVFNYWYTYQSWWIPKKLFDTRHIDTLTQLIFQASKVGHATLHLNKGLAGASEKAIHRTLETSFHPAVVDATALLIMSASEKDVYLGVKGKEPDKALAKQKSQEISSVLNAFQNIAPQAGTYANEADYFMPNWQDAFWGKHYERLKHIKNKYDPDGLFYCHHCVGSELYDKQGVCRIP